MTVSTIVATGSAFAADSDAFTTVFNGGFSHNEPVFVARPKHLYLGSAYLGTYDLTWTRWTGTEALGHGTARPDHGVYKVKVRLSDPLYGTFQHFAVTVRWNGKNSVNYLDLATPENDPSFNQWAPQSWIRNHSASGLYDYIPDFSYACPDTGATSVGGRYEVTGRTSCKVGVADFKAGGIKCQRKDGAAYSVRSTYDGYTVKNQPAGILFEHRDHYFTLAWQCSY